MKRSPIHPGLSPALEKVTHQLLQQRGASEYWTGELSSSALSTATAVTALSIYLRETKERHKKIEVLIENGLHWLAQSANNDGGWGDTDRSISNISTTALCWAAFGVVPGADQRFAQTSRKAEEWLARAAGSIAPGPLAEAIIKRYGNDRTFSVPILTMCALAGRLGKEPWQYVIPLPFELAALPQSWFAALRLPVVSYALPALIAMGQVRHHHAPSRNFLSKAVRKATREKTLRVLQRIQPSSGGFLEATPLTSFVAMSLAASGEVRSAVTEKCIEFLIASARADGSWPIDTNLATWVTTLSSNALGKEGMSSPQEREKVRSWLLAQQYGQVHPYTNAAPGGWAWTDLPGGVPDADDTAGALLALHNLTQPTERKNKELLERHIAPGVLWLISLQNGDGGIPTFCKGWTNLPFDRSSPDITAHALRAWKAWAPYLPQFREKIYRAVGRAITYLLKAQQPDGSWIPLWFGNQFDRNDENHVYGTSRVLIALGLWKGDCFQTKTALERGLARLVRFQQQDGSFAGALTREGEIHLATPGTVEETALALEALTSPGVPKAEPAKERALGWLIAAVERGALEQPAPIGFYFARLWYYERLYPLIFTRAALRTALQDTGATSA